MKTWLKKQRGSLLSGLSITGLVILARLFGVLQPLEWKALDLSLRARPAEPKDPRITIVTITEDDIQTVLDYPISDQALAELIQTLQTYRPRVIGIDIFRDKPVGEGYQALEETLESADNIVGINKIDGYPVEPPPALPDSQIGFADAILDSDGFLRRSLLASADEQGDFWFSLTIRLVEQYLAAEELTLENGLRSPEAMRFGTVEIPQLQPNTGGYVRVDNGGIQTLINFRAGAEPFEKISYKELISGQVAPERLEDRVVLVGYTAQSVKDFVSSGAIVTNDPSLVPGVEIQAHAVSQILSAVYENRPFLRSLPNGLEYFLILASGLLGIAITRWRRRPTLYLLVLVGLSSAWLLLCYNLLLLAGWWLPLVPTTAAFALNAIALPLYQTQRRLTTQLEEREALIDSVFNSIHNGPLQRLSGMIRTWPEGQIAPETTRKELIALNEELRNIHTAIRAEMLLPGGQAIVTRARTVDLQIPLESMLYEIYKSTLERHQVFFSNVLQITAFEPMADSDLSVEQKRDIGRFLEEVLINVYKHAKGTTRLVVNCVQEENNNVIRITDNGAGMQNNTQAEPGSQSNASGYGTQQAQKLAASLGGKFTRTAARPKGTCCELRWPIHKSFQKRWFG